MSYTEYKPCEALRPYIDAYWEVRTALHVIPSIEPLLPDGCTDIIINMGAATPAAGEVPAFRSGHLYLVGTMTGVFRISRLPGSHLAGIRFKPGALAAFYDYPMQEIVNRHVELDNREILSLADTDAELPARLDRFFLQKLSPRASAVIAITNDLYQHQGQLSVDELARRHHLSHRTMERMVKQYTGISPKALTRIIRLQSVFKRLKQPAGNSLLHIAYDTGYYDHAHLANEVKKYTGLRPSDILQHYQQRQL